LLHFLPNRVKSMKKLIRLLHTVLPVVAVVALLSCGGQKADEGKANIDTSPDVGKQSMESSYDELFALPDLEGETRTFSEFSGKPLMLNFWATWCPPCRREIPYLAKIYDEYKPRGLEIVGISLDSDASKVKPFVEQYDIDWLILHGDRDVVNRLKIGTGIPVTIFYYANGTEAGRIIGAQPERQFRQYVTEIMSEYAQN
jgi:thiol-disulfide isomerase/thioredoxin